MWSPGHRHSPARRSTRVPALASARSAPAARCSAATSRMDRYANLGVAPVASATTRLCPARSSSNSRPGLRRDWRRAGCSIVRLDEDRQCRQHLPLRVAEQADAPLAVARTCAGGGRRAGPVPRAWKLHRAVRAVNRGQQSDASGGDLDVERQAVGRRRSRPRRARCPRQGEVGGGRLARSTNSFTRATRPAPRWAGGSQTSGPSTGRRRTRARRASEARCGSWRAS